MARKPTNQHRMLTLVGLGRVIRVTSSRKGGSWQLWESGAKRWRPVISGENKALDTLAAGERPMIEVTRRTLSGQRAEYGVTPYGEITKQLWDQELGPVTLTPEATR